MQVLDIGRLPVKTWLPEGTELDEGTLTQARNLANLPCARLWVAIMPDCHLGYGMPIGGVLATERAVVPNAVGVDIGCGMIAVRLEVEASLSRETLQAWRLATHARVPVGFSGHEQPRSIAHLPPAPGPVSETKLDTVRAQLGTLGGGNHFIELQSDEEGRLWLMLHSGSRGLGKAICDHYQKAAKALMQQHYTPLADYDLSFLPFESPFYAQYMAEMEFALIFAEQNRAAMLDASLAALAEVGILGGYDLHIETHHNFARLENHHGKNLMIHRKGAVHAKGLVTIPGSMGTASYIGTGTENPESFATCSHGAGRVLGRKQASRTITKEQAVASMEGVVFGIRDGDHDEMPAAYKDIDAVMAAQGELVEPLYRLKPLAVVKG